MELTMTNNFGFCELNENEMMVVDGGGMAEAGYAFLGVIMVGIAPAVGVTVGVFATPVAGVGAGAGLASAGCYFLDKATA